jgi:predicted nucleic acid-binding protein
MEVVDTSVLVLGKRDPDIAKWMIDVGEDIGLVDIVALEYLMGAPSATDYLAIEEGLSGFRRLTIEVADWDRVRFVHRALADKGPGEQRSVHIPDLLIAAVAERHAAELVHYDEDYDRIAVITRQPTRWIAPRGSI